MKTLYRVRLSALALIVQMKYLNRMNALEHLINRCYHPCIITRSATAWFYTKSINS